MHGSIRHVDTADGLYLRSRGGPELGTLEKVRMNVSEPWTTKDVWEYGAWEVCRSPLSWHRYVSHFFMNNFANMQLNILLTHCFPHKI